jgi:phosphoglucomutase
VGAQKNIPVHEKREKKLKKLIKNPPATFGGKKVLNIETIDGIKLDFAEDDWILLRFSGTEPIIRCYAEAETKKELKRMMKVCMEMLS